jgi:hypothetical protein
MLKTYTSEGLTIFICPFVEMQTTRNRAGKMKREGLLYCSKDVQGLKSSFSTICGNTLLKALRSATEHKIDDATLIKSVNLATMLELPLMQLPELFKAAVKLGYALGLPATKAINDLSRGIGRQSRLILDNLGIVFKAESAYTWFATEHNLTKLTQEQKTKAWKTYAINQVTEKAERV